MEKYSRYSNYEVLYTSSGVYTGRQPRVNHSGGFGCLAIVLVVALVIVIEVMGPESFLELMSEVSAFLLQ